MSDNEILTKIQVDIATIATKLEGLDSWMSDVDKKTDQQEEKITGLKVKVSWMLGVWSVVSGILGIGVSLLFKRGA